MSFFYRERALIWRSGCNDSVIIIYIFTNHVYYNCIVIREHSIFAIRNLLHNNLENQKLVQELSPIEVMQHPILSDIGVATELDNNNKIKIKPLKNEKQ